MNKIITTLTLCLTFGQTEHPVTFEYGKKGINDCVVTLVEGKNTSEIYNKTINWIKETYKNPDKVLKMEIKDEKARINGVASDLLLVEKMSFTLDYVIEIAFKDNRYKFDLISLSTSDSGTDYKNIPNFKTDKKLVRNFGESPQRIESYLNGLNRSLKNYIVGKKMIGKKLYTTDLAMSQWRETMTKSKQIFSTCENSEEFSQVGDK